MKPKAPPPPLPEGPTPGRISKAAQKKAKAPVHPQQLDPRDARQVTRPKVLSVQVVVPADIIATETYPEDPVVLTVGRDHPTPSFDMHRCLHTCNLGVVPHPSRCRSKSIPGQDDDARRLGNNTCCDDTGRVRGGNAQERHDAAVYYQLEASFFGGSLVDSYGYHGRQDTAADLRDPPGPKRKLGAENLKHFPFLCTQASSLLARSSRTLSPPGAIRDVGPSVLGRLVAVPRSLSTLWAAPVRQGQSPRTSPQSLPAPLRALQKAPRVRPRSTTSRTARGLFPDYQVVLGLGSSGAFFPFGIGLIYIYFASTFGMPRQDRTPRGRFVRQLHDRSVTKSKSRQGTVLKHPASG